MPGEIPKIMTIEHPEGWQRQYPVPKLLDEKKDPLLDLVDRPCHLVVEIGSQWGWWARRAAKFLPEARIYCVDPWSDTEEAKRAWRGGRSNLDEWMENVAPYIGRQVVGLRGTSEAVAAQWERVSIAQVTKGIDFLFIDGDHHREAVFRDLQLWVPKVRPGGLISGHDWGGAWGKHVRPAVKDYFNGTRAKIHADLLYWAGRGTELSRCWWVRKDYE